MLFRSNDTTTGVADQCAILTRRRSEEAAGRESVNSRQPPSTGQDSKRRSGELRRWSHRGQVQDMPPVRLAITPIEITIVRIGILSTLVVIEDSEEADAVRPRVVRTHADSGTGSTLN